MDLRKLKTLIELVESSGIAELKADEDPLEFGKRADTTLVSAS